MLVIHNTMSGRKESLVPIHPGQVRMYVCGMTVYDYCHIGHARVLVVFDMIARYLRTLGYAVTYVRNITDIDDKIIARAAENDESAEQLAARFTQAMQEDATALGVLPVDAEPRATEHIAQIVAMIQALFARGYAYQVAGRDVYFRVARFADYGRLSGRKLAELRVGERVAVDEDKENPLDFVLWKAAKPGEPSWDSPWGKGRPGWHIECSAMSTHCLGEHFDIHGGGQDLQFPHHENEIAQAEGASGHRFVNHWIHNGFVQVNEEKMSKSLGNTLIVRDILQRWPAEAVRFFILSSHYRSELHYSDAAIDEAERALRGLYTALRDRKVEEMPAAEMNDAGADHAARFQAADDAGGDYTARFQAAMADDFNTPQAIAILHELGHALHGRGQDDPAIPGLVATMKRLAEPLGLLQNEPESYLHGTMHEAEMAEIEALITQREQAREARDFASADELRAQLSRKGVVLEDQPQGTLWRRL